MIKKKLDKKCLEETIVYNIIYNNNKLKLKKEEILAFLKKSKIKNRLELTCLIISLNKSNNLNFTKNEIIELIFEISGVHSYLIKKNDFMYFINLSKKTKKNKIKNNLNKHEENNYFHDCYNEHYDEYIDEHNQRLGSVSV